MSSAVVAVQLESFDHTPDEERVPQPLFSHTADPGDEGDDERSLKSSNIAEVLNPANPVVGCQWLEEDNASVSSRPLPTRLLMPNAHTPSSVQTDIISAKLKMSTSMASLDSGLGSTCQQPRQQAVPNPSLPGNLDMSKFSDKTALRRAMHRARETCGYSELDPEKVADLIRTKYNEVKQEDAFIALAQSTQKQQNDVDSGVERTEVVSPRRPMTRLDTDTQSIGGKRPLTHQSSTGSTSGGGSNASCSPSGDVPATQIAGNADVQKTSPTSRNLRLLEERAGSGTTRRLHSRGGRHHSSGNNNSSPKPQRLAPGNEEKLRAALAQRLQQRSQATGATPPTSATPASPSTTSSVSQSDSVSTSSKDSSSYTQIYIVHYNKNSKKHTRVDSKSLERTNIRLGHVAKLFNLEDGCL